MSKPEGPRGPLLWLGFLLTVPLLLPFVVVNVLGVLWWGGLALLVGFPLGYMAGDIRDWLQGREPDPNHGLRRYPAFRLLEIVVTTVVAVGLFVVIGKALTK